MSLNFVNLNGETVSIPGGGVKRKKSVSLAPESFRKGFRVVGIPPGEYEAACEENKKQQKVDDRLGVEVRKDLPPYALWSTAFKSKPVRAKPYEIESAAEECAALALKAGWDRVFVVAVKREAAK